MPTRECSGDVGGGGGGVEAERGREGKIHVGDKEAFRSNFDPRRGKRPKRERGGKSNSLPAHSAESRAGLASYVLLMSVGLDGLGKALVHADIVSSAILTCINSLEMARKCQLHILKTS